MSLTPQIVSFFEFRTGSGVHTASLRARLVPGSTLYRDFQAYARVIGPEVGRHFLYWRFLVHERADRGPRDPAVLAQQDAQYPSPDATFPAAGPLQALWLRSEDLLNRPPGRPDPTVSDPAADERRRIRRREAAVAAVIEFLGLDPVPLLPRIRCAVAHQNDTVYRKVHDLVVAAEPPPAAGGARTTSARATKASPSSSLSSLSSLSSSSSSPSSPSSSSAVGIDCASTAETDRCLARVAGVLCESYRTPAGYTSYRCRRKQLLCRPDVLACLARDCTLSLYSPAVLRGLVQNAAVRSQMAQFRYRTALVALASPHAEPDVDGNIAAVVDCPPA